MKRIDDLRKVWPHEAHDFTKWLAEEANLAELGDAVGIDLELEERESSVGGFSADLFASESGTDRKVIIENQLEVTNHDHLGKLITYASGKDAQVIIWIVKRARDEHRQAVEWLNQHIDSSIGFFLVEIELWQIDNSLLAPKFSVVEKPNDWAKNIKIIDGMNDTQLLKLAFWETLNDTIADTPAYNHELKKRKAQPHHWYDLSIGTSAYHISLDINTQKKRIDAGLYIPDDKETFNHFKENKDIFDKAFGTDVEFHDAGKSSRILVYKDINIQDKKTWPEAIKWLLDNAILFKKTVRNL